jgi:hypothetical protein
MKSRAISTFPASFTHFRPTIYEPSRNGPFEPSHAFVRLTGSFAYPTSTLPHSDRKTRLPTSAAPSPAHVTARHKYPQYLPSLLHHETGKPVPEAAVRRQPQDVSASA